MEFEIMTDLENLPATVEFNFDALKAELEQELSKYEKVVVTPDTVPQAKATRAVLNKRLDAMEKQRQQVKKMCLSPYDAFEAQYDKLYSPVKRAIANIDNQVKDIEETDRQEKYRLLQEAFNEAIGSLAGIVPIEMVLDPKWGNKTLSVKHLTAQMVMRIAEITGELAAIRRLDLPYMDHVIVKYLDTLNLTAALDEAERLKTLFDALNLQATADSQTYRVDFSAYGTTDQLDALAAFLRGQGIRYDKIPDRRRDAS